MIPPQPEPHPHAELRAALERDAARLPQGSFDAALHASVMRKVRATLEARPGFALRGWLLPVGAGAATLWLGLFAIQRTQPDSAVPGPTKIESVVADPPAAAAGAPTSMWTYQQAVARNDGALVAMLDRDMCHLLPPSPAIFSKIPASEESITP